MKNRSLFDQLDASLKQSSESLLQAPWEDPNFYAAWLAQTTYYVRHSTRLLALAGALSPLDQQEFHNRFLKHAAEEKGHENLTLLDLKHLGQKIENLPEFPATQSFYQTQYHWIEKISPLAFFGYILCLECLAVQVGPQLSKITTDLYGPKGSHFLRVHSEEDIGHVKEAVARVEKLPLETQDLILKNMLQSFENYDNILRSCIKTAAIQKNRTAA